jgi:hypothetical protein
MPKSIVHEEQKKSNKKDQKFVHKVGWEKVLEDAESSLHNTKAHIRSLRAAVRTIRSKIQNGEPFPAA